ncbi:MAG: 2-succinyl-5-enolpyruvyl-6-hydroxy-3-cyclohexene-1-carboxylic-acid synthase [bacterium]|nr:2-succinyl-5-enolpyruvyl-6-hydroxy-3-cyclohexene-1-carboxylic-acid synthase [bacterium]
MTVPPDLRTERPASAFVADPAAVYAYVGAFFHGVRAAGVEHVVVSPGSRSTPLTISARHTPGLRTWVELDERAAAFFALGLAKASGRPAVLVCTSGTAAANYLPAIVEAHYSRVPMIVATTDRPPELRDWGAGQTIEQNGLYGGYTRWASEVPIPEAGEASLRHAGQLAGRAFDEATSTPAGAVHLNWPLREPLPPPEGELEEILAASAAELRVPRFSAARAIPAREDIDVLAGLAEAHERGVILVGPRDDDPALADAIAAFGTASGWPVLADPAANLRAGREPGRAPILDAGDLLLRDGPFREARVPEVVVRVGDPPVSKPQRLWIEAAEPREVLWLDEGGQWGEPSHRATRVVRGGAAALLDGAAAQLGVPSARPPLRERAWCRDFEAMNTVARAAIDDVARDDAGFCGLTVASAVARCTPDDAALFVSNSMAVRLLDLGFGVRASRLRVHASRGAAGIDGINSTALGIAAATDRPTVLFTGDLAFLHDLSGLLITRRVTLPLTIVVLDDDGGGIFSMLPIASQGESVAFRELFHTPHGLDLERVAGAFALPYSRVSEVAALEKAIEEGTAARGVSIVHVPVEAGTNETRYRAAVAKARAAVDAEAPS